MTEYNELNHMEKCKYDDLNKVIYFLPHHTVLKNDRLTTKTRVFLDGSFNSISGLSLNDILFKDIIFNKTLYTFQLD